MPNVYSKDDVIEMQQGFAQELKEIHTCVYNILSKYTNNKEIKLDLVKLLENVYDRQVVLQKDINIEASNSVETENASN